MAVVRWDRVSKKPRLDPAREPPRDRDVCFRGFPIDGRTKQTSMLRGMYVRTAPNGDLRNMLVYQGTVQTGFIGHLVSNPIVESWFDNPWHSIAMGSQAMPNRAATATATLVGVCNNLAPMVRPGLGPVACKERAGALLLRRRVVLRTLEFQMSHRLGDMLTAFKIEPHEQDVRQVLDGFHYMPRGTLSSPAYSVEIRF